MSPLIPKTIEYRERDCAWGCARRINTPQQENLQIEKHKSGRRSFRSPDWFVLFDLQIFWGVFVLRAQPDAQSLFLFPIVFGINLIHFFDEKKDGAARNSIVCFGASIPCHAIWEKQNEERELFRIAQRSWQRKVWTQRPSRGEKLRCKCLARKSAKHFGWNFWRGKVQNSLPISALLRWRHFRLTRSLSLSLCISLSHRAYLRHNIGSASALPIIISLSSLVRYPGNLNLSKQRSNAFTRFLEDWIPTRTTVSDGPKPKLKPKTFTKDDIGVHKHQSGSSGCACGC